ncbi:hypothetical protein IKF92_01745 [Candidatus Saccharibacteria bacterium]|nr:hypothetical protein [Candidatus Saccharibacteria bacterium]
MSKQLEMKDLLEGIKKGMSIDDFCEALQCDEEEFKRSILRLYKNNDEKLKKIMREIKKKSKRKSGNSKKYSWVAKEIDVDKCVDRSVEKEESEEAFEVFSPEMSLEELDRLEENQSIITARLEMKHKGLVAEHQMILQSVQKISTEINGLIVSVKEKYEEFQDLKASAEEIAEKMKELSADVHDKKVALMETRQRIHELELITLCVYESGEITAEGERRVELNDSGSEKLRNTLLKMEECQNLRVKDVGTLAKLIAIVKNLKTSKYEVVCDEPEIERIFNTISI